MESWSLECVVMCLEEFVAYSVIGDMNWKDRLPGRVTRYQGQIKYIGQEVRLIVKVKNEMIHFYNMLYETKRNSDDAEANGDKSTGGFKPERKFDQCVTSFKKRKL